MFESLFHIKIKVGRQNFRISTKVESLVEAIKKEEELVGEDKKITVIPDGIAVFVK